MGISTLCSRQYYTISILRKTRWTATVHHEMAGTNLHGKDGRDFDEAIEPGETEEGADSLLDAEAILV